VLVDQLHSAFADGFCDSDDLRAALRQSFL
jgi:hypothetical protein